MIIDGERLKALVSEAQNEVLICAPFIKLQALQIILSAVPSSVFVKVVTRWRPAEVAAGVSDLDVFELISNRGHASLELLDDLHAKIYVADRHCLVGSANITATALGWSKEPNIEFLTEIAIENADVQVLLKRLSQAQLATFQIKAEIEKKAKELAISKVLDEENLAEEEVNSAANPWLPRCAAPDHLYKVYLDKKSNAVVLGTRHDALDDLRDLSLPAGLSESDFKQYISTALAGFPAFSLFLERISAKLTDHDAIEIMQDVRPGWEKRDLVKQWEILRDWIRVFYADQFEVAPESFVVRVKRKDTHNY